MNKKLIAIISVVMIQIVLFQPAVAANDVTINAAGSTFAAPILETWASAYSNMTNGAVKLSYGGGGSGFGISSILGRTVDFAGSDAPLNPTQQAQANQNGRVIMTIPESAGAIVMTYNIPSGLTGTLNLTADNIAQIFQRNITKWNDPSITTNNPGLTSTQDIVVVHRSDASGTSFAFSDYLTRASTKWVLGTTTTPAWPANTVGGKGNDGVAGGVKSNDYSIGYVELGYALKNNIKSATLQNKDGKWVTATLDGVNAAANTAASSLPAGNADWSQVSINNQAGPYTYPIATFTYLFLYKDLTYLGDTSAAMVAFFKFIMTDSAQQMGPDIGYVPLPSNVLTANLNTINSLQYSGNITDYMPVSGSSTSSSSSNSTAPGFEAVSLAGLFVAVSIVSVMKRKNNKN